MTILRPICIGSVFPDCSPSSQRWLDLQLKYIRASTPYPFDYFAAVHGSDDEISDHFIKHTKLLRMPGVYKGNLNTQHLAGIRRLKRHFMTVADQYSLCLFLDMDAWPIRKDWADVIAGKLNGRYDIAVAQRAENLDRRLHCSILVIRSYKLHKLQWSAGRVGYDLIGNMEADANLASFEKPHNRRRAFVLLRSNRHQIHPVFCGVYYDLFYHNGGSGWYLHDGLSLRSSKYWRHAIDPEFRIRDTVDALFADPNAFIGKLIGRDDPIYAKV